MVLSRPYIETPLSWYKRESGKLLHHFTNPFDHPDRLVMTAQSRTDSLRRRFQARQGLLVSHSPLQSPMLYSAAPPYSSDSPPPVHQQSESKLCREMSFYGDEKFELENALIHGWLGKSTGAATVSLEWSPHKFHFEIAVRSERECTTVPIEGDVRVNVDHRVVRIGLQDKTVHLRFLTLCDSCRFTALLLQELPRAADTVRTVSTEKLFMWADYVPACSNHKQLCRKGELLWAFWIALSAIWAVVKLSRMIPVEVWQGWMTALQHIVAHISKTVLDFCGVPFSQTILDWAHEIAAWLLNAVNFLVPVHFILPIEVWLQSLWNVGKALSLQRLGALASWAGAGAAQAVAVLRPVQRLVHAACEALAAAAQGAASFASHFVLLLAPVLAPVRLVAGVGRSVWGVVRAVAVEQLPALLRPLLAPVSALAAAAARSGAAMGPVLRRVSEAARAAAGAVGRMGGNNVASAGSTAARYSVGVMCELGGTVWRHVKAAFVETVRLCFQKLEAHVDRGLAISTDRTPSPPAHHPPNNTPSPLTALRPAGPERSPSPLFEIRRALSSGAHWQPGPPGHWPDLPPPWARDPLRSPPLPRRSPALAPAGRGMAGAAGRAWWNLKGEARGPGMPVELQPSEVDSAAAESAAAGQGAETSESQGREGGGAAEGGQGGVWVVVGRSRKKRERARDAEAEAPRQGKRRVSRRKR